MDLSTLRINLSNEDDPNVQEFLDVRRFSSFAPGRCHVVTNSLQFLAG